MRAYLLICFSCVRVLMTLWTITHQAPLSMGFSRQEYWSGLPCPPPGDLPDPGIESRSPALQVDSLLSEPPGKPLTLQVSEFQDYSFSIFLANLPVLFRDHLFLIKCQIQQIVTNICYEHSLFSILLYNQHLTRYIVLQVIGGDSL